MSSRALLRAVAVAIVLLGIAFRVHDVAHKTFFQDEAYSALRITGHTEAEYLKLRDGSVTPYARVAAFQQIDAGTTLPATLRSIATEEPQRGPVYYGLAELLVRTTGTSIAGFRFLGVVCGVLAIGAAFLFGLAYFRTVDGGLVVAALVALSPFHIAYARQAREYGLLSLVVFLSAAALFRALHSKRAIDWIAFALATTAGLLVSPFFVLVVASYVSFVAYRLVAGSGAMKRLVPFAGAIVAAALLATPWYRYALGAAHRVAGETAWGASVYPLKFYVTKMLFNLGAMFFDYEFANVRYAVVLVALLPCIAYLAYRAYRAFPDAVAFAVALAVPTVVVVFFNDYRTGAHFGTIPRYLTAAWIGVEIVVAAGIVAGLRREPERMPSRTVAAMFGFFVVCGAFCGVADARYVMWWDNNENEPTQIVAATIDAAPHPIVIIANFAIALSLAHYLEPHVRYELYAESNGTPRLDPSGSPNFVFFPIARMRAAILAANPNVTLTPALGNAGSTVGQFHRALESDRVRAAATSIIDSSPANALWTVAAKKVPATR